MSSAPMIEICASGAGASSAAGADLGSPPQAAARSAAAATTNFFMTKLRSRTREGRGAERAELHIAGERIALDLAVEFQRDRHRRRHFGGPFDAVAGDRAVFDRDRAHVARHRAGKRCAAGFLFQYPGLLAHRGLDLQIPLAVNGHFSSPVPALDAPASKPAGDYSLSPSAQAAAAGHWAISAARRAPI